LDTQFLLGEVLDGGVLGGGSAGGVDGDSVGDGILTGVIVPVKLTVSKIPNGNCGDSSSFLLVEGGLGVGVASNFFFDAGGT
jgi:hypothetical protein